MIAKRTLLKSGGFAALCGGFATLLTTPALTRRPYQGTVIKQAL